MGEASMSVETDAALNGNAAAGGEPVSFASQGASIVGRLFPAAFGDGPSPAITRGSRLSGPDSRESVIHYQSGR
jgi:hypothetical protein